MKRWSSSGAARAFPVGVELAARYAYTGVDASAGMLDRARARLPGATFVRRDMEDLDIRARRHSVPSSRCTRSSTFPASDTRICSLAIASWLRPGGALLATTHSRDSEDDYQPDWLGGGPMRWSGFDAATNISLIESAGMQIVETEEIEQVEPEGTRIRPLWIFARRL